MKKNNSGIGTWMIVIGLVLLVGLVLTFLLRKEVKPSEIISKNETENEVFLKQAIGVEQGFKRLLTAGYAPNAISYGDGGEADMLGRLRVVEPEPIPPALLAIPDAAWGIGKGQVVGEVREGDLDYVIYLYGLTEKACSDINRLLWNDPENAAPHASGIRLNAWKNGTANVLEVFDGKNRSEACITTAEGEYFYYRVVKKSEE
jgi:hypothetical protein